MSDHEILCMSKQYLHVMAVLFSGRAFALQLQAPEFACIKAPPCKFICEWILASARGTKELVALLNRPVVYYQLWGVFDILGLLSKFQSIHWLQGVLVT